ncbi:hypothetical protein BCR37DRAFT_20808 [Protomyces lactucae-debilis]|uniref:Uncharacterized protein n=1 Tax=Protomyces lactucae-debilis TaxID=2754530 RepID=A0A1Y2FVJ2_PROLT|nr:uncharacterized protein BCR37DRAFT_20808 [Protomyces lactucae-debilis]ORY88008.1 hypothetical protein BCR37DRAFT_20808 [Protomyces lactucae-debilis]
MLVGTIDYAAMQAQSKTRVSVSSSSPHDPLNWPRRKKDLCFGILCVGAVLAATLNPNRTSPILLSDNLSSFTRLMASSSRDCTRTVLTVLCTCVMPKSQASFHVIHQSSQQGERQRQEI